MSKLKFLDFETFPEWWCVVVSDEDTYLSSAYKYKFTKEEELAIKSKMRVYTSDGGLDETKRYLADTSTGVLSGYNIKGFDLIIQKCIAMNFTPRQVYIASQIITEKFVFPAVMKVTQTEIARISAYVNGWSARWQGAEAIQDLMDDSDKGLKDKESAFGMDIRETTVPFGKMDLSPIEKCDIIFYCKHDVFALHVQYACVSKPYIDTKLSLGRTYDLPAKVCYASTNAVLTGKMLGAERVSGTTIVDPTIVIYEKPIRDYIEKWVPKEALDHLLTSQKPKQMKMFGNKVFMADGGIHSTMITPSVEGYKESAKIYAEACEEWGLYNIDLSGCHPSVMLFVGAMPRGIKYPDRFKESVFRRRHLKSIPKSEWTTEDKDFILAGKLIHNTTFGAAGNKYLPLYDDYMRSKVCRVSQMIIIAVSSNAYKTIPNCQILQTNTDGILIYMKHIWKDTLKAIIKEFEDLSQFSFELEQDSKIWQLNVNNYIAINDEGKDKLKGKSFVTSIWQPGYNKVRPLGNHVIAKCQYDFYVNQVNPIQKLLEHTKVDDFVLTATKGNTYTGMIHSTAAGDVELGKVARLIATESEEYGDVRKLKIEENRIVAKDLVANCPPHAVVVNDALYNYTIEGPAHCRVLKHISGKTIPIDMAYYVDLLDNVLDIPWVMLKNGKLVHTTKFNLKW